MGVTIKDGKCEFVINIHRSICLDINVALQVLRSGGNTHTHSHRQTHMMITISLHLAQVNNSTCKFFANIFEFLHY